MTEAMIVEAVRSAGGSNGVGAVSRVRQIADPQAVQAFRQAMEPDAPSAVPFASQVAETWRAAQDSQQEILHRMSALSDLSRIGNASLADLTMLQYEVANLSFQQEVVTSIAKKASDGVTTLIKNQ